MYLPQLNKTCIIAWKHAPFTPMARLVKAPFGASTSWT
jgi:hypothetical protein